MTTLAPPKKPRMARKQPPPPSADPRNDPLHHKLRRLIDRKAKGRTDAEIAEAAGMNFRVLSELVTGRTKNPRYDTLRSLLNAINADFCDLERS